ncbi:VanZ family protein [Acidicapsa ligni]|uniref:VanZ family protein n=1 Tax=Acidicapsa ligni TaxID=542300 RepID=UPI0021E0AD59|nr:VanZ family protein [Acidicapsa ligni]
MSTAPIMFSNSYQSTETRWSTLFQAWLPVMLCACVFAIESTATFGTDHTSGPLRAISQALTGETFARNWSIVHHEIRKAGHFSGYGILSLVCFRGFWLTLRNTASKFKRGLASHWLAIYATFLVASADEIHQHFFLPNRTGLFSDVVLDSTGAMIFQTALFLILGAVALYSMYASSGASSGRTADNTTRPESAGRPISLSSPINAPGSSSAPRLLRSSRSMFLISQAGRKAMRQFSAAMHPDARPRQLRKLSRVSSVDVYVSRRKIGRPKYALTRALSQINGD